MRSFTTSKTASSCPRGVSPTLTVDYGQGVITLRNAGGAGKLLHPVVDPVQLFDRHLGRHGDRQLAEDREPLGLQECRTSCGPGPR